MNNHILCIPRVGLTISENDVYNTLNEINIIKINHIKFIFKNRELFNTVLIYFSDFLETENGELAKNLYLNNKDIKVMYNLLWFWKITPYKYNKRIA
jgi:hypothetical protein